MKLIDIVKGNAKAHFTFYRCGNLWYKTDCGFEFPVPIQDCGDAVFLNEDKAILFMRYIHRQLEMIKQAKQEIQETGSEQSS